MGVKGKLNPNTKTGGYAPKEAVIPRLETEKGRDAKHSRAPYSLPNKSKRAGTHVPKREGKKRVMHEVDSGRLAPTVQINSLGRTRRPLLISERQEEGNSEAPIWRLRECQEMSET